MPATCIKTLHSHAAHARFLATCSDEPVGYIPRQKDIPSPYAYSPVHSVYMCKDGDRAVFIVETSHRKFQVFTVPTEEHVTDEETAENAYMRRQAK